MFLSTFFTKWNEFWKIPDLERQVEDSTFKVVKLALVPNPRYPTGKLWGYRPESMIDKIIVHQEMGDGTTLQVHKYHTSVRSHLKPGTGAPKIAYHFTIEKDGRTFQVNEITDVTCHCRGQNMKSIGIMLVGNFDGENYEGTSIPTNEQLESLKNLLDKLINDLNLSKNEVYGHRNFGKPACPGYEVMKTIHKYKG